MQQFALVLDDYVQPPVEQLSALFQAVCGWTRVDAMQRAARVRGILAERLAGPIAGQLATALTKAGMTASIVLQSAMPQTVRGRRVNLLLPEADRLGIRWTLTSQPQWHPWHEVLVMSAGVVFHEAKEQVIRSEAVTHYWPRHAVELRTEVTQRDASRDLAMAAISLGTSPQAMQHLRIRAPEVEYATIFGDDVQPSSLQNFCLLLARIGLRATGASITPETMALIEAGHTSPRLPSNPRFAREDDFDDYQRWLVARHWLSRK
jgi:hypothetical protein